MTQSIETPDDMPVREGWALQHHHETFSGRAGPYYFREGSEPGVGFFAKPHHGNLGGVVHGGALMTLADMALFDICFRKLGVFKGLTVTLNAEFLGAGPLDAFIEASGEVTNAGRKLVFARGMISSGGDPILAFSGTLKRLSTASSFD